MPTAEIVIEAAPERETVSVDYRHEGDGVWAVDVGDGFEQFASFDCEPDPNDNFQERTVVQLLRKDYDVTYGGDPDSLGFD